MYLRSLSSTESLLCSIDITQNGEDSIKQYYQRNDGSIQAVTRHPLDHDLSACHVGVGYTALSFSWNVCLKWYKNNREKKWRLSTLFKSPLMRSESSILTKSSKSPKAMSCTFMFIRQNEPHRRSVRTRGFVLTIYSRLPIKFHFLKFVSRKVRIFESENVKKSLKTNIFHFSFQFWLFRENLSRFFNFIEFPFGSWLYVPRGWDCLEAVLFWCLHYASSLTTPNVLCFLCLRKTIFLQFWRLSILIFRIQIRMSN